MTASKLDCGTVCTASFGFGKPITLTANPDDGSLFDGWNGVCARTQLTCTFPAGPITSIRAVFTRDATAPTTPGVPVIGSRTRTSHRDLVGGIDGQRPGRAATASIVDDASAGETQTTAYTLAGLKCGRTLRGGGGCRGLAREQVAAGRRHDTDASLRSRRPPGRHRRRARRRRPDVVAVVRVNRATTARLRLLRGGRQVLTARFGVAPGTNRLRLRVPRRVPQGPYRLATIVVNPDGGTLALPGRGVLLPRP